MASLNKVMLIGRLGQDPESRTTSSGAVVANVSMAVSESYKDKSGQKQEKTEWIKLIFWNRLAEIVTQYCHKGSQIYVEGRIQTQEWNDKDGNKRYTTSIVARSMQMLDSKGQSQGGYQQQNQQQGGHQYPEYNPQPPDPSDILEDDIPF